MEDGRCKLGVAGRLRLVRLIESGCSLRSAAAQSSVSSATVHRWWHRWQQASEAERVSRACLRARAPVPRSCPWRLDPAAERRILAVAGAIDHPEVVRLGREYGMEIVPLRITEVYGPGLWMPSLLGDMMSNCARAAACVAPVRVP